MTLTKAQKRMLRSFGAIGNLPYLDPSIMTTRGQQNRLKLWTIAVLMREGLVESGYPFQQWNLTPEGKEVQWL